jgi:hypothetical protein
MTIEQKAELALVLSMIALIASLLALVLEMVRG